MRLSNNTQRPNSSMPESFSSERTTKLQTTDEIEVQALAETPKQGKINDPLRIVKVRL